MFYIYYVSHLKIYLKYLDLIKENTSFDHVNSVDNLKFCALLTKGAGVDQSVW